MEMVKVTARTGRKFSSLPFGYRDMVVIKTARGEVEYECTRRTRNPLGGVLSKYCQGLIEAERREWDKAEWEWKEVMLPKLLVKYINEDAIRRSLISEALEALPFARRAHADPSLTA